MPVYSFYCECGKELELKMTFKEHDEHKDNLKCIRCGKIMTQQVAPPNFRLGGGGWFSQDYAITDMETRSNLDLEKRIENEAHEMQARDNNIKEN